MRPIKILLSEKKDLQTDACAECCGAGPTFKRGIEKFQFHYRDMSSKFEMDMSSSTHATVQKKDTPSAILRLTHPAEVVKENANPYADTRKFDGRSKLVIDPRRFHIKRNIRDDDDDARSLWSHMTYDTFRSFEDDPEHP
ncbi:hypothetical protein Tco_0603910 [Tanacetum coccineum]